MYIVKSLDLMLSSFRIMTFKFMIQRRNSLILYQNRRNLVINNKKKKIEIGHLIFSNI